MQEPEALGGGLRTFPKLQGNRSCDVLIVGGGLAGLITACRMSQKGLRTILIDAHRLGSGATAACMGIATAQTGTDFAAAVHISETAAGVWAQLMLQTVRQLPELFGQWRVRCGFRQQKSIMIAANEAEVSAMEALLLVEERLRLPVYVDADTGDCPFPVRMAVSLDQQLAFEPMALFADLIETALRFGVSIYEYTPVRDFRKGAVMTDEGSVSAQYTVLATGWPISRSGEETQALLKQKTWIVQRLTGGMPCRDGYLRVNGCPEIVTATAYGLIAAGCAGKCGTAAAERQYQSVRSGIEAQLQDWSVLQESAVQCVHTAGGLPLVGPLERLEPQLLVAAGFGIHGLAGAALASDMLVRQITGRQLAESRLFMPYGSFHQHAAMRENRHPERLRRLAAMVRHNVPVCPHRGSRMRWNASRRMWECPCHGSSFTADGKCKAAPAMLDAHIPAHMRRR